jgi:hypothetical protein
MKKKTGKSMPLNSITFEQLKKDPIGKIYIDRTKDNIRFIVLRGPASLCAYLSVTGDAGKLLAVENAIDREKDELDFRCHGGITFHGQGRLLPPGYWFGWDYGHAGDRFLFEDTIPGGTLHDRADIAWTPEMVDEDSKSSIAEFKGLVRNRK